MCPILKLLKEVKDIIIWHRFCFQMFKKNIVNCNVSYKTEKGEIVYFLSVGFHFWTPPPNDLENFISYNFFSSVVRQLCTVGSFFYLRNHCCNILLLRRLNIKFIQRAAKKRSVICSSYRKSMSPLSVTAVSQEWGVCPFPTVIWWKAVNSVHKDTKLGFEPRTWNVWSVHLHEEPHGKKQLYFQCSLGMYIQSEVVLQTYATVINVHHQRWLYD